MLLCILYSLLTEEDYVLERNTRACLYGIGFAHNIKGLEIAEDYFFAVRAGNI